MSAGATPLRRVVVRLAMAPWSPLVFFPPRLLIGDYGSGALWRGAGGSLFGPGGSSNPPSGHCESLRFVCTTESRNVGERRRVKLGCCGRSAVREVRGLARGPLGPPTSRGGTSFPIEGDGAFNSSTQE